MYLDGAPIAMLRYGELPAGLEPIWESQRHRLPFRPGEPIRYRETKVQRYRLTEYLHALGIRLEHVTEVHLHGARDSAIVLTQKMLAQHADDVLFKFAGETFGKPIPLIRNVKIGTTFDDLKALAIYVKRTPPRLAADQSLELDGIRVRGIPYHGEPLREGVRVYLDNRLAAVLKRNQLQTNGETAWQLDEVLARHGVTTDRVARLELIHDDSRTETLPWTEIELAFSGNGSGEVLVGKDARPATALALFTAPAGVR